MAVMTNENLQNRLHAAAVNGIGVRIRIKAQWRARWRSMRA